jgi:serine/threonine protein kinase/WD40 repeat protein
MSDSHPPPALSPAQARQIDRACDRFEAAWKAGRRPDPREHLGAVAEPVRSALLRQLLLLDWDYRCRAGDEPCPGDYQARFPGDAALVEGVRREMAEGPDSTRAGSVEPPAGSPVVTVEEPPVGECPGALIGPYKLVQQIGEGGMGAVWMAQQTEPVKRLVAVKLIKAGLDSRQLIARFEAERQALALMDHPHIAKVLDAGTTKGQPGGLSPGTPYFVMELVKGVPITQYCDEHRLTPRQRLGLFLPVCQAVQHAHQKGIIHRDLKPSNVLVAPCDGVPVPKVIDFGLAKAAGPTLTDKTLVTGFGAIVGTLEYMSPEQAELNQPDIDTRSDIYSLGVLLYELLAGSPPFSRKELERAGMLEMLRVIREQEPSKPSTKLSTAECLPTLAANRGTEPAKLTKLVRGELDWIVMKALEKDRNRRYETANAFAMDVQRYLADEPVLACPPSVGYRLRKFARRNKGSVLAVSLVVLALMGGIIGTTWGMIRAIDESKQKQAALTDARDKLWLSLYERARAGRFSRQVGQRLDSLAALAEAARIRPGEDLRDEAIAAMALPDVRRTPAWHPSNPPGTTRAVYGGHYRLYARADTTGIISIRSIAEDQEVRRIASGRIIRDNLHFSPDERFLLHLGEGNTLRVWRVADGQPALRDEPRGCVAPAFSPDGRRLAVGQQEWVLCFDLATGQEVKRWRCPGRVHWMDYHPDNGRLAVGYFSSSVTSVYDTASGGLVTDLPVGPMNYQAVAWHPDGERLAVGGADPRIQIWNVTAKRQVATLEGHSQRIVFITFHPEGGLVASHSWDGTLRLWDPSTGRPLLQLALTLGDRPRFSGDGRWLAAALNGEQTQLLEVTPNREYRTLVSSVGAGQGTYSYYADISPDGRLLAAGMDEGARLWDVRSGRELAALHPGASTYVAFEARGEAAGSRNRPRALLAGGWAGLLRWPVTTDDPEGKHLRLGPPQQLSSLCRAWFARAPDGRTLAVVTEEGGANQILDLDTGAVRRELGSHPAGEVMALSRDGRWAASSGWVSDRVRLWNAGTGQMVHEWVFGKRMRVFFTPDSRSLVISRDGEFSFWDVATLQPIRRLARDVAQYPGHVAFSPDGKVMAMEMAPAVLHVKEVATGRTVARLEDPHGDRAYWQGFTPDGSQLVVVSRYASAIHIWDLRAIRARLKEMNLDWDWPEFPPAEPSRQPPLQVEVKADPVMAARYYISLSQWDKAAAEYAQADWSRPLGDDAFAYAGLFLIRGDGEGYNRFCQGMIQRAGQTKDYFEAYILARSCALARKSPVDPARTVQWANQAVASNQAAWYFHVLGLAQYRAGQFDQALQSFTKGNAQPWKYWEINWFGLALVHHRLGHADEARQCWDKGIQWLEREGPPSPERPAYILPQDWLEAQLLRREAEEMLKIKRSP